MLCSRLGKRCLKHQKLKEKMSILDIVSAYKEQHPHFEPEEQMNMVISAFTEALADFEKSQGGLS